MIPDSLKCLFSGEIKAQRGGKYLIEVPRDEVEAGLEKETSYRIGIFEQPSGSGDIEGQSETESDDRPQNVPQAPVKEGDIKHLEVTEKGAEGDGIAFVDGGYAVVVDDVSPGQTVTAEIVETKPNVAFASVTD